MGISFRIDFRKVDAVCVYLEVFFVFDSASVECIDSNRFNKSLSDCFSLSTCLAFRTELFKHVLSKNEVAIPISGSCFALHVLNRGEG